MQDMQEQEQNKMSGVSQYTNDKQNKRILSFKINEKTERK